MQMNIINKSFVLIKVNIHIQELQNKPLNLCSNNYTFAFIYKIIFPIGH